MLQSSERILPRYLNDGVIVSGLWSMVKAGRVCGVLELHWLEGPKPDPVEVG